MKKLHKFIIEGVLKQVNAYPGEFISIFNKSFPNHTNKTMKQLNLTVI